MGDQKSDQKGPTQAVLDATLETVVLGIDFVGTEIDKIPNRLTAVIQDLNFQKEIENFLTEYGKLLLQKNATSNAITLSDAEKLAIKSIEDTGKKAGQEVWKDVSERIQQNPKFVELKEKFQKLEKSITDQPIGVWFTDSKAYLVASGLIINGAAIVFFTSLAVKKVGTPAVLSALEGQTLKFKPFGSLELASGISKVDRTSGVVDWKVTGTDKWKSIKVELDVVAHTTVNHLAKVEGAAFDAKVSIPIAKNIGVEFKGGVDAVKFEHKSILVDLQANLKVSSDDGTVSLGIGGFTKEGGGKRPEFGGTLGLEFKFK